MDDDQTPRRPGRSPFVWGGVAGIVVALGLGGLIRAFAFNPDSWLGRWYVQLAVVVLAVGALSGGSWLINRGRATRVEIDLPE